MSLRKSFFISGGVALYIIFASLSSASAAEITLNDTQQRYAGSFLLETQGSSHYLWYVAPETGTRFAVRSGDDLSQLLVHQGVGIHDRDLIKIPMAGQPIKNPDFALAERMHGKILLDLEVDGKAWYVDPLSRQRVYIANGAAGYVTTQRLALDILSEHLDAIPITSDYGFSDPKYGTPQYNLDLYKTMFSFLRANHLYKSTFTNDDLFYGSLKGMAEGTGDPYTIFHNPTSNAKQKQAFFDEQAIEGIGALLNIRDKKLYVVQVLKNTPAERAGLLSLDQITYVGEASTSGMTVEAAVGLIKGPAGTQVNLTIYRPSNQTTFTRTITRERIVVPTVESESYENGAIAYFRISVFNSSVIPEFTKALKERSNPQLKGMIIDLRDNPGGLTSVAADFLDQWLNGDQTVFIEKTADMMAEFHATNGRTVPKVPTYILINEESASASEIVTSALRYYKEAKTIGTKTYGKGTGQALLNFEDGSGLRYTTFEWLPPDGKSIDKVGISPDFDVQPSDTVDTALEKAKSLILNTF